MSWAKGTASIHTMRRALLPGSGSWPKDHMQTENGTPTCSPTGIQNYQWKKVLMHCIPFHSATRSTSECTFSSIKIKTLPCFLLRQRLLKKFRMIECIRTNVKGLRWSSFFLRSRIGVSESRVGRELMLIWG